MNWQGEEGREGTKTGLHCGKRKLEEKKMTMEKEETRMETRMLESMESLKQVKQVADKKSIAPMTENKEDIKTEYEDKGQ